MRIKTRRLAEPSGALFCYPQFIDYHNTLDRSLSTGHSNSTVDMLSRLETMVLSGADLPVSVVRKQIASAIDIFIHLSRLRDRSRRVTEIAEVAGFQEGEIVLRPLYIFQEEGEEDGKIIGKLVRTNELLKTDKLQMAGIRIPSEAAGEEGEGGCPNQKLG